ncbi:acylphosphatase [Thermovibrio sp.]
MAKRALHGFVSGVVQGVGYRAFTRKKAKELSLKGYVRNLPDGRVEFYAEGEEGKLLSFLKELQKGPFFAKVERIEYHFLEPRGEYEDFYILY